MVIVVNMTMTISVLPDVQTDFVHPILHHATFPLISLDSCISNGASGGGRGGGYSSGGGGRSSGGSKGKKGKKSNGGDCVVEDVAKDAEEVCVEEQSAGIKIAAVNGQGAVQLLICVMVVNWLVQVVGW